MARAVAQYVVAALLALLSTHAAVPSARLISAAEIVWCGESEGQSSHECAPLKRQERRVNHQPSAYESRILPAPDSAVLFQRPPPVSSLFF